MSFKRSLQEGLLGHIIYTLIIMGLTSPIFLIVLYNQNDSKTTHDRVIKDSIQQVKCDSIERLYDSLLLDKQIREDACNKIKVTPFDNGDIKKALKKEKKHHKKNIAKGWIYDHVLFDKDNLVWAWGGDSITNQTSVGTLADVEPFVYHPDSSYYWYSLEQYNIEHDGFPKRLYWSDGTFAFDMDKNHTFFNGIEYTECTSTNQPNINFKDVLFIGKGLGFEGITTRDY